jgi:hypothetical protein
MMMPSMVKLRRRRLMAPSAERMHSCTAYTVFGRPGRLCRQLTAAWCGPLIRVVQPPGAVAAMAGSCVTTTTVWPSACSAQQSMIAGGAAVELPVGSSASSSSVDPVHARLQPLRWPPDISLGRCFIDRQGQHAQARSRAHAVAPVRCHGKSAAGPHCPRRHARHQIEVLEHEADLAITHFGLPVLVSSRPDAVEFVATAGGRVQVTRMFISVDLPEPDAPVSARYPLSPMLRLISTSAGYRPRQAVGPADRQADHWPARPFSRPLQAWRLPCP